MSFGNDNWLTKLTRLFGLSNLMVQPGRDWMQICMDLRTGGGCRAENDYRNEFCSNCGKILRHALKVLKRGAQVENYRVVRLIGHGSFGAVYEAQDMERAGRRVALKETFDPNHIKSYVHEFGVLRQLAHPNLARYEEALEVHNHGYLVMEFVGGQSLQDVLHKKQGRPLLESQVIGYALQLCDVLTYLHSQMPQILHRDIKPANIRLTPEGLIKLVDFGLLKQGIGHTRTSRLGLTEGYAPLEQYPNSHQTSTPRTDIYSLGATFYHLLTGKAPISAQNRLIALNDPQQSDPLCPPQKYNPHLSSHVAHAIMQAMKLQPTERYPDAQSFKRALTGLHAPAQPDRSPEPAPAPVTPPPTPEAAAPTLVRLASPPNSRGGKTPSESYERGSEVRDREVAEAKANDNETPPVLKPERKNLKPKPKIHLPHLNLLRPGARMVSPKDGMTMVYVPAGEFLMGSGEDDRDAYDDEKPPRKIYLDAFWIDLHPVTNAMFKRFVKETGYQTEAEKKGMSWAVLPKGMGFFSDPEPGINWQHPYGLESDLSGKEDHPVVQVSWNDAQVYCQWAGRRLPTEAEWEKAARGTDGSIYPWGNAAPNDKLLNFNWNVGDTTPVGKYPDGASPYGALDMAGNVWEWIADWYDENYYKDAPTRNPTGPISGQYRALRGGSWFNDDARVVRAGNRNWVNPALAYYFGSFRCARSP